MSPSRYTSALLSLTHESLDEPCRASVYALTTFRAFHRAASREKPASHDSDYPAYPAGKDFSSALRDREKSQTRRRLGEATASWGPIIEHMEAKEEERQCM